MSDIDDIFARSLHHASKTTEFGEAFAPPIVNTSVYRLADDPSGPYQYARWAQPDLDRARGIACAIGRR